MTTFTVEDGTGLDAATSYVSTAFADSYLGADWADTVEIKEAALMAATEYADVRWGFRLQSKPLLTTQALQLPRFSLYDRYGTKVTGVPDDWQKAVCLYAEKSVAGALYPVAVTSALNVKKTKTVVGPITTEKEYHGSKNETSWLAFPLADTLIKQSTAQSSSNRVIR